MSIHMILIMNDLILYIIFILKLIFCLLLEKLSKLFYILFNTY